MARRAAVLIAGVLLVAAALAVGLGRGQSAEPPSAPRIEWVPCRDGAECGTLEVPLDHADPSARTIRLFVARRSAADPRRRLGVLLHLPAGAGALATPQVLDRRASDDIVDRRFDLVAVDPRGVSAGTQVLCLVGPAWFLGANVLAQTDDERAREAHSWRAYAQGCDRRSGWLLPNLSTVARAHDLELLRAALGAERLTLLGQGYGAALASVYARLYPDRVRAAVLDGGYETRAPLGRLRRQQAAAAERALETLLDECARDRECPLHAGGDPYAAFDRLLARLEERPGRVGWKRVGLGEALGAVVWGLTSRQHERLLHALAAADGGDLRLLRALADEPLWPDHTATAVSCRDRARSEWELGAATVAEIHALAPRLARFFARRAGHACSAWPADPDPPPAARAGAGSALVVGSAASVDAPLAWSLDLADALDDAALLIADDVGGSAVARSSCVRDAVEAFLVDLELPQSPTVCSTGRAPPRPAGPAAPSGAR